MCKQSLNYETNLQDGSVHLRILYWLETSFLPFPLVIFDFMEWIAACLITLPFI